MGLWTLLFILQFNEMNIYSTFSPPNMASFLELFSMLQFIATVMLTWCKAVTFVCSARYRNISLWLWLPVKWNIKILTILFVYCSWHHVGWYSWQKRKLDFSTKGERVNKQVQVWLWCGDRKLLCSQRELAVIKAEVHETGLYPWDLAIWKQTPCMLVRSGPRRVGRLRWLISKISAARYASDVSLARRVWKGFRISSCGNLHCNCTNGLLWRRAYENTLSYRYPFIVCRWFIVHSFPRCAALLLF